ncbi:MAG: DUF4269 domain-containing protein [Bacteroidia bacterium]|nr:DUF4269 domain-containing protein [Bacteroidia bacterium]
MNFDELAYLKSGSIAQHMAYEDLMLDGLWDLLEGYKPRLCGTIPLGIQTAKSDLDIICEAVDLDEFFDFLNVKLSNRNGGEVKKRYKRGLLSVIAQFEGKHYPIEIFCQNLPVEEQFAYRHMLIEHRLLEREGDKFKQAIIGLKEKGYKTEPAFSQLLGLDGDPYLALLAYGKREFGI